MILDDILDGGIRRRSRVHLFESWIHRKLLRDWQHPMSVGGVPRPPLSKTGPESLDETLLLSYRLMELAARLMLIPQSNDDSAELAPYVPIATLEKSAREVAIAASGVDVAALVTQSLLMPVRERRIGVPIQLRFAHRSFQEYFLARALLFNPEPTVETTLPRSVAEWLEGLRTTMETD
jgi:hypothetical protein